MDNYQISKQLIQDVINYLANCKYAEVAPLIEALAKEINAQIKPEEKKEETGK